MSRREQLEAMLRDDPSDVFLRYALAMEEVSAGDGPAAISRFQDVLESNPDYVAAYFQLGQLFHQSENLLEARDVLLRGIATADRVGDGHAAGEMREYLTMITD